jgi:hypothetical protein
VIGDEEMLHSSYFESLIMGLNVHVDIEVGFKVQGSGLLRVAE